MTENQIATQVVDACYAVHTTLGPGLLESVYAHALEAELKLRGLHVEREVAIGVTYKDVKLAMGFRADLIVEGKVIVELKAQELVPPVAAKVLNTYLRLTGIRLGLLVNFETELIKDGIKRIVNRLPE